MKNNADKISKRKDRCLRYIKTYIETDDNSASRLRNFMDDWYGYYTGGPHLNRNCNVRWLNNPDCTNMTIRECLEGMDFISMGARAVLDGTSDERLIKEHSVPIRKLRELLTKLGTNVSTEDIEKFLKKYYKLGVLTKEEDNKINQLSLNSTMPNDWDGEDMFARYATANIRQA